MTAPYLRYEPEWTWVAESEGKIVGFLMSSVSPYFHVHQMCSGVPAMARMALKLNRGLYADHPRSERFARWFLFRSWKERAGHPKGAAHMHYNIEKEFRGTGLGLLMWKTFEHALLVAGKRHYYGKFFSWPGWNKNYERICWRCGAQTYSRNRTSIFDVEVSDLEMICVHKQISYHRKGITACRFKTGQAAVGP